MQTKLQPDKGEHNEVLKTAQDAIDQADKNLQTAKQRLESSIKKYKERGRVNGPIKLI